MERAWERGAEWGGVGAGWKRGGSQGPPALSTPPQPLVASSRSTACAARQSCPGLWPEPVQLQAAFPLTPAPNHPGMCVPSQRGDQGAQVSAGDRHPRLQHQDSGGAAFPVQGRSREDHDAVSGAGGGSGHRRCHAHVRGAVGAFWSGCAARRVAAPHASLSSRRRRRASLSLCATPTNRKHARRAVPRRPPQRLTADLRSCGVPDAAPRRQGRTMVMLLSPKKP